MIADEASHVADETFFLVVPTDGSNCGLLNSQSHRIVGALTWQKDLQNKQITGGGVPASSPMLKLYKEIESVNGCFSVDYFSHTFVLPFLPHL